MKKKGQVEVWEITTLFEVILAVFIAIFLISSALTYSSYSGFNKAYLKEDVRLLINAIHAAPGDMKVTYPVSDSYSVKVAKEVKVGSTFKVNSLLKKHNLVFEKKGDKSEVKMTKEATI